MAHNLVLPMASKKDSMCGSECTKCTSCRKEQLKDWLGPPFSVSWIKAYGHPGPGTADSSVEALRAPSVPELCGSPDLVLVLTWQQQPHSEGSCATVRKKCPRERLLHKMPHLLAAVSLSCAHEPQGAPCIFIEKSFIKEPGSREQSPPFPSYASWPNFHFLFSLCPHKFCCLVFTVSSSRK